MYRIKIYNAVFVILLALVVTKFGMAQQVKWYPGKKTSGRVIIPNIIGYDEEGVYAYETDYKSKFIKKYNFDMNLIWSQAIPLLDKNIKVEEILIGKKSSKIFFSIYSFSKQKHGYFCLDLPFEQNPESPPLTIFDQSDINAQNKSNFSLITGRNQSNFAGIHDYAKSNGEYKLTIQFLDQNLQSKGSCTLDLSDNDLIYDIKSQILDSVGDLFLLTEITNTKLRNSDPNKIYYRVIHLAPNEKRESIDFFGGNYFINDLKMVYDFRNKKLVLGGFFSETGKNTIRGNILATISCSDGLVTETVGYEKFSDAFTAKLIGAKNSQEDKELSSYYIRDVILRTDGGLVLIAESYYTTTQTYTQYNVNFPVSRDIIYYHYDEILAISINPDGKTDWTQIIPKNQVSRDNSKLGSFAVAKLPEKLSFVFNDDVSSSQNFVYEYSIDYNGKLYPNTVMSAYFSNNLILATNTKQLSSRSIVIPGLRKKKEGLLKITY